MRRLMPAALLLLSPAATFGADLQGRTPAPASAPIMAPAATTWEGFHLGVHGGYAAKGASKADLSPVANADGSAIKAQLGGSGVIGGLQAGYSLQTGGMVVGVEADIAKASLRGSQGADGVLDTAPAKARLEGRTDMVATLRGRIGYAFDHLLIYGTGGYATAHHDARASLLADGVSVPGVIGTPPAAGTSLGAVTVHQWVHGWTLGAGGELAFSRNVSLKLEYLYAQVGNKVAGQNLSHSLNLVRTGVNYRF